MKKYEYFNQHYVSLRFFVCFSNFRISTEIVLALDNFWIALLAYSHMYPERYAKDPGK